MANRFSYTVDKGANTSCISLSGLSGSEMPWTKGLRYSSIQGVYTASRLAGRGEALTRFLRSSLLNGFQVAVSRKAACSSLAFQREFGDRISPSAVSESMYISFILFSLRVCVFVFAQMNEH